MSGAGTPQPPDRPARRRLIHVDRELVRAVAKLLGGTPGWKRRPLRRLIDAIYELNSLAANLPNRVFDRGLPRPSEARRELDRLAGLAGASRPGQDRLAARIAQLGARDAVSTGILQGLLRDHPVHGPAVRAAGAAASGPILQAMARAAPAEIAALCRQALALNWREAKGGRGGNRRLNPDLQRLAIVDAADRLYAAAMGRHFLGVTGTIPRPQAELFYKLARLLLRALGYRHSTVEAVRRFVAANHPQRLLRPPSKRGAREVRPRTRKARPPGS